MDVRLEWGSLTRTVDYDQQGCLLFHIFILIQRKTSYSGSPICTKISDRNKVPNGRQLL